MRVPTLSITLALTHLLTSILAVPLLNSPPQLLSPRNEFCTNAPTTKVGTLLTRHPRRQIHARKSTSTIRWCAPSTQTYIILTIGHPLSGQLISTMLGTVINIIQIHIQRVGDAVLGVQPTNPATVFQWTGERGLRLNVANTNNHQTTWGVLGAALTALEDYMQSQDSWGSADFTIYDGSHEVGRGTLE